jgi:hypothetical protein
LAANSAKRKMAIIRSPTHARNFTSNTENLHLRSNPSTPKEQPKNEINIPDRLMKRTSTDKDLLKEHNGKNQEQKFAVH